MRILLQNALKKDTEVIEKDYQDILKFLKELVERIEKIGKWLK